MCSMHETLDDDESEREAGGVNADDTLPSTTTAEVAKTGTPNPLARIGGTVIHH